MNVLSCVYNELQCLYRRFNTTIKRSTEVNYFDLPHVCFSGISQVWKMQGTRLGKHGKSLQEDAPSVLPLITKTKFKRHYDINRWFWKRTSVAKRLRSLNIENCINVDESSIFKAKDCLSRLERINITTNMHFSVRAIACLLIPFPNRGLRELYSSWSHGHVFLGEDFSPFKEWRYSAGNWQNYFDIVDIAAEDDILKSYFKFILAFLLLLLRNCYVLVDCRL